MSEEIRETYEVGQPWVIYRLGYTHDQWWPFWNSTRILGRAKWKLSCMVCGDRTTVWAKLPRFGKVPDRGYHPARRAYLDAHAHPDRGHPMSWARPLENLAAHERGLDLDQLAMRLETDLNEGGAE